LLQNSVGPQVTGATDLKAMLGKASANDLSRDIAKDFKGSDKGSSFEKALQEKLTSRLQAKDKNIQKPAAKEDRQKLFERKDVDQQTQGPSSDELKSDSKQRVEEKSELKVADHKGLPKSKAEERQQAIKEFMDSFESEFQIPSTRLVEAMAKLDDSQLMAAPEETADAVIDQLDLDDAQAEKASAMYAALLLQLQQISLPAKSAPQLEEKTGFNLMSSQTPQMRFEAVQARQDKMLSELDNMNRKLSLNSDENAKAALKSQFNSQMAKNMSALDEASEAVLDAAGNLDSKLKDMESALESVSKDSSSELTSLPPHLQGQMKEVASPALLAALAAKKAQEAAQMASEQSLAQVGNSTDGSNSVNAERLSEVEDLDSTGEAFDLRNEFKQVADKGQNSLNLKDQQQASLNSDSENAQDFDQQQNQSSLKDSKEFSKQSIGGEKEDIKNKLAAKANEFKTRLNGLESMQAQSLNAEPLKADSMTAASTAVPMHVGAKDGVDNQTAVKQLMNQAQYLIKKGGGEVKVEMTPGDMGTVHLKVMLKDGKVNLEMSAQTSEAKNTIESSLAELKNSLAAHKLSVENVKVDVVSSASADTATQNQTQSNNQGQDPRDQARQFWNQFGDNFGNQGRRESFTEFQNFKGYAGAKKERDPLKPIETNSSAKSAGSIGGRGKGLNLVA
jgi:flagellar hook-length control protein FliK